jgi:hypothetical protein
MTPFTSFGIRWATRSEASIPLTWELCEEPVGRELTQPQAPISEPTEETDDPFKDIPDLSVDELQEMMRVHGHSGSGGLQGQKPAYP